jgi:hypothetical protein
MKCLLCMCCAPVILCSAFCRLYDTGAEIPVYMRKDAHGAASDIQKVFRGYMARMRAAQRREDELVFIGMKPGKGDSSRSLRSAFEVSPSPARRAVASLYDGPP